MTNPTPCVFDTLESRTLLSGGHSLAVVSDKAQVAIDVKLLHSHSKMHQAKVHHDQAAIHRDMARIKSATQHHIKADMAAFNKTLKADRKAITTAHKLDVKLIAADNAKIRADHANATLLAQDEAQLQLDDQKMADDSAALEGQLEADDTQETTVLAADELEGQNELDGTDPTLQADENQLNQDEQAGQDDQQNDNNQLNSDETKLNVDIEAEANGGHHN